MYWAPVPPNGNGSCLLALEFAIFCHRGPQHPRRQLGSALISGGQNVSSWMLFLVVRPSQQTWADLQCVLSPEITVITILTVVVIATLGLWRALYGHQFFAKHWYLPESIAPPPSLKPNEWSMRFQFGFRFPYRVIPTWTRVDPMWTQCGPNVDSMWIPFPLKSEAKVDPSGPNVDPRWTQCGFRSPYRVSPKWTHVNPKWIQCGLNVDSVSP